MQDERFTHHSTSAGTHLPSLLEFATLSASRIIVGTAGSSFPTEAANMGNTTAIIRALGILYPVMSKALRRAAAQVECDISAPTPPSNSVLLPPGSCGL
eukprot:4960470-Prymnesium_polylepis.2